MAEIGSRTWTIPEGYIPSASSFDDPALVSHEAACILNAGDAEARITITLYFADRGPAGPYHASVPAQRTMHLRFNDLVDPEPVPRDTPYSSVIEASRPVVVQHTRLDSRKAEVSLLSTIAYPAD
ncbi:MAG: sensory rhodopsin transducer [Pseudomonadota bacterium]